MIVPIIKMIERALLADFWRVLPIDIIHQIFYVVKMWILLGMCETENLSDVAGVVRELGLCYLETFGAINGFAKELRFAKRLWREGDKSRLVRLGLTLLAFPTPVPFDDMLGVILLSAGLIQKKVKTSALYAEDICISFPRMVNQLNAIRQDLVLQNLT